MAKVEVRWGNCQNKTDKAVVRRYQQKQRRSSVTSKIKLTMHVSLTPERKQKAAELNGTCHSRKGEMMYYNYPWSPTIFKHLLKSKTVIIVNKRIALSMRKRNDSNQKQKIQPHSPNRSLPEVIYTKVISWVIHEDVREWKKICTVLKRFSKAAHAPVVYRRLRIEDMQPSYPPTKVWLTLKNRCYECQNLQELFIRGSAKICYKRTIKERLRELHMSVKWGNTKAKYLIALAYHH